MESIELKNKLNSIKDKVLNKVLIVVLFVQVIGITISVLRIPQTGFKNIYGIHMFLALVMVLLFIFRYKLPTTLKGCVFMGALYVMAITGLSTWGLYGFGYVYYVPATAVAFMYFNKRTARIITLGALASILIIGALFIQKILWFAPESVNFMQTFPMWMNMIITLSLVTVAITLFWNNLQESLIQTYLQINEQQARLKKMNDELVLAKEQAEQSDKLKSSFLANMSHEIRTPLNIIIGFSGMVAETDDEGERQELHKTVKDNCDILLKLVNDIVDYSKIETESISLYNTRFNINKVLQTIKNTFETRVEPGVQLSIDEFDYEIYTDKDRLIQLLYNLVDNAAKFTKKGNIELATRVLNDKIVFTVCDTGIGIEAQKLERIFDRFYKIDSFCHGAGLGLCITKWIVKLMNGQIVVESELGKGTIFTLTLPTEGTDAAPRKNNYELNTILYSN